MNFSSSELDLFSVCTAASYNVNTSNFIITNVPTAKVFYQETVPVERILMFVCAFVTLIIILDFVNTVLYVMRYYNTSSDVKYISLEIIGVYPVVSVSALITLFVPRSDLVCELMTAVFISHCMVQFTSLMTHYYGGKKEQLQLVRDSNLSLQGPPCCCCCCCLPQPPASERNVQVLKALVLQGFVLQPLFILIILVLWLDGEYTPGSMDFGDAYIYLTIIQTASTLLSLYAFILLFRLFYDHLKPLRITNKFFALQLVIIFTRLQDQIWSVLSIFDIPPDRGILSGDVLSSAYDQMLIIFEMLILTIIARRAYRRPHEVAADMIAIDAETDHHTGKESSSSSQNSSTKSNGHTKITIKKKEKSSGKSNGHISIGKGKYNMGYNTDVIDLQPSSKLQPSEKYYSSIE